MPEVYFCEVHPETRLICPRCVAKRGGMATAKKYGTKQLAKWGTGGRPHPEKDKVQASGCLGKINVDPARRDRIIIPRVLAFPLVMKTPQKIPLVELGPFLERLIQEQYREDEFGGLRCRRCDLPVRWATSHFSVHTMDTGSGCAGPGTVTTRPLPYCLQCEGEPPERDCLGCVHVPWRPRHPDLIITAGRA